MTDKHLCLAFLMLAMAGCSTAPQKASPPARPSSAASSDATPVPPLTTGDPPALRDPAAATQNDDAKPVEKASSKTPVPETEHAHALTTSVPTPSNDREHAPATSGKKSVPTVAASPKKVAPVDKPAAVAAPTGTALAPGKLRGHIDVVVGAGQSVTADEVIDAVVYFIPDAGAPHPKPEQFRISTRNKQFEPSSLVIPLGSTVKFPNQDEILHNVFSASPGSAFDLGIYGEGGSGEYTFKKAGLVLINCNVHQSMQASVLVLDTPYFVHPSKNGDFQLAGLPPGRGKLMLWHPRATVESTAVTVPTDAAIAQRLMLVKPRVGQHLNKERNAYQPDRS